MAKDLEFFKTLLNGLTNKIDSDRTWDKLKDKPFYEEIKTVNEPLSVTWDGNTEGLVRVGEEFFKVSDVVLTDDQIKTSTIFANVGFSLPVIDLWDSMVEAGMVTEDVVAVGEGYAIFVRRPGSEIGPFVFPEAGIYFVKINDEVHISGITTTEPVEQTKVITKKIDPKFLPDGIVSDTGGSDTKYVIIETELDNNTGAWMPYTNTQYADILSWIESGTDVMCIWDTNIYTLSHVSPPLSTIAHEDILHAITFSRSDVWKINEIVIHYDNWVEVRSKDITIDEEDVQSMIDESLRNQTPIRPDLLQMDTNSASYVINNIMEPLLADNSFVATDDGSTVSFEGKTFVYVGDSGCSNLNNVRIDVVRKSGNASVEVVHIRDYSDSKVTGEPFYVVYFSDEYVYTIDNKKWQIGMNSRGQIFFWSENDSVKISNVRQIEKWQVKDEHIPTDHINSLIDAKLGVIENGTY